MATQASDTGTKTRARAASDELAIIAQRAQAFTNASGTAIALSDGTIDEITCRARSGATAPEVGTPMRVEGSFTGLCIHSGKELRCDDAETDTRVDTTALRSLGIRSLVVTPIREETRVVGVLMVFAPTAHAFTITHVAVLKTMADQISALLLKDRRAREGGIPPESIRPSAPAPVAMPRPVSSAPVAPPPVVIKPSAPAARAAAFPVVSRVEPIKTAPIAEEISTPVLPARREERRRAPRVEHRAAAGALDTRAAEEKKSVNPLMLGIVIVVVIAAVVGGTFVFRRMNKAPNAAALQRSPEATNSAVNGLDTAAPRATGTSQPQANGYGTVAGSNPVYVPRPTADPNIGRPERNEKPSPKNNVASDTAPPAVPSPTAVSISAGTSKIAAGASSTASSADQGNSDVTPMLNFNTNSGGGLNSLTRPTASATPSVITQSDLESAQVMKRVAPVYPAIARARRLNGTVTVRGVVGTDGRIRNLQLVSGPPVFRDAAFDAVRQWQFKPAKLNGQLIEQTQEIRVAFNP